VAKKTEGANSVECANKLARFAHAIDPSAFTKTELDAAVQAALKDIGRPRNFWDIGIEFQLNSLLSGFGTPIANAASVVYKQITNPMLDAIESLNPKSQKELADVIAGVKAMLQGFGADAVYFKAGWQNGYPLDIAIDIKDTARRLNMKESDVKEKIRQAIIDQRVSLAKQRDSEIDETAVRASLDKNYKPTEDELNEFVRESYDYVRGAIRGTKGEIIRMPTKLSVAIDEYGKARFRRYKIAMLASQKARRDANGNSAKERELYDTYMKQSMEHVAESDAGVKGDVQAEKVKASFAKLEQDLDKVFGAELQPYNTVKEYALREMFQQRLTGLPQYVQDTRNKYPLLHLLVPFMKTPWNITKEGFSYVPGVPMVMKKYMKGPVDEDGVPVDIKNLGAYYELTNEEMIARQIMGTTMFAVGLGMVQEGLITGKPRDAAEAQSWKDAGIPQSSIRIGDTWVSYERIEPIATTLGLIAEMGRTWDEVASLPEVDQKWDVWAEEIGKGTGFAIKANIMQKSFMDGFNGFFNDVAQATDQGSLSGLAVGVGRQFTPAILNQIARSIDPMERQATSPVEKIQQRIPLLREDLPVEYGMTGGARERNLGQALTSFNIQSAEQTPLQKYIYELGVTKMREDKDLKSVELNNDQLALLRQMSNDFITPRLERYVASESFQKLPDARKKVMLEKRIDAWKRVPRQKFYNTLRRTDPAMARKFKIEQDRKRGRLE
jgi:hypothetical protein